MNVCHIWHSFYPLGFGGVETYILTLSDFLSRQDQSLQFLMLTDKAAYVPFSRAIQISRYQRINRIEVNRLGPNFSSFLRSASCKLFHRPIKAMDDILRANLYREAAKVRGIDKVDIFHLHGFWKPLYPTIGLLLSQHFHRPFIVTLHGDSANSNDPYSMPLIAPETLNVLGHANAITTFSKEVFNILGEVGLDKKSHFIPNFVDTRLFKRPYSCDSSSRTSIVMMSRLSKSKDPITPIRAFAQVKMEVPEATLKIVGDGPLYEYANRLVQKLNLGGSVKFYGHRADVREFLWNSEIAIGTKSSYLTTLEAWAAGLAVVGPDSGILKELVTHGENGLLVPLGNIDQLASELINLIRNKHLRTTIATNGQLTSEKYDIRNIAPSIASIYKSLL